MAGVPKPGDFIDRLRDIERRLRRLETRSVPYTTENFIFDPVTPRALPGVYAASGRAVRVAVKLRGGGPITVNMILIRDDVEIILHTFTDVIPEDGWVVASVDDGVGTTGVRLKPGDEFFPHVTSGTGNNFSGSFVVSV